MDPTALVTFLYRTPPQINGVELLGSWDNFRRPYRMHADGRRGPGIWTGCFKFENIVFDGDRMQWGKPRNGGLKQGGTYWYFYRLNDDLETHDESQPHTAHCPLLPGQVTNVLEVPIEVLEPPTSRHSLHLDVQGALVAPPSTHTLDPSDKFSRVTPPPMSKVHGRYASDLALNGRLENPTPETPRPDTGDSRPRSPFHDGPFSFFANRIRIHSRRKQTATTVDSGLSSLPSAVHSEVVDVEGDGFARDECYSEGESAVRSAPSFTKIDWDGWVDNDGNEFATGSFDCYEQPSMTSGFSEDGAFLEYPQDLTALPQFPGQPRSSTSEGVMNRRETSWLSESVGSLPDVLHTEGTESAAHLKPSTSPSTTTSNSSPYSGFNSEAQSLGRHESDPSDDICSPTFSVATVSTDGEGIATPWRLSLGSSVREESSVDPRDYELSTTNEHIPPITANTSLTTIHSREDQIPRTDLAHRILSIFPSRSAREQQRQNPAPDSLPSFPKPPTRAPPPPPIPQHLTTLLPRAPTRPPPPTPLQSFTTYSLPLAENGTSLHHMSKISSSTTTLGAMTTAKTRPVTVHSDSRPLTMMAATILASQEVHQQQALEPSFGVFEPFISDAANSFSRLDGAVVFGESDEVSSFADAVFSELSFLAP